MRSIRSLAFALVALGPGLFAAPARAQILINEIVDDEREADSTQIVDTREFVELYNAGASPVDLSNWTLGTINLATGAPFAVDTIPSGSTIPAGGFFVIGAAAVPNVNFVVPAADIFYDNNAVFELRDPGGTLVDAVGLQTFQGIELAAATQEQLDQIAAGQTVGSDPPPTGGWWGQMISSNTLAPNSIQSLGRYLDGRDTNRSGYDFGVMPATPGASNNLPQVAVHTVPDVDAMSVGTQLGANYHASFVLPRVIEPGTVSGFNPNPIPASPQGGRAIIAYDETGGGNASYSRELVNSFDIWAYIDTSNLNVTTSDTAPQSEATAYGIGTTDPFFGTPNSADLLTGNPGGNITSSSNGSTGLGWLIQRRELFNGGAPNRVTNTVLQLLDMNDGGDGVIADNDWQIEASIDLSGVAAGWHRLAIDYDPATGNVEARFDDQTFNFTTVTGLVGNFYVGYRENLPGTGNGPARPPTYDLFVDVGLTGDYNGDGTVDAADYVVWRNDPAGNGGAQGYTDWAANFGKTAASASGSVVAAVPEPTSAALVAVILLTAASTRRRP